MSTPQSVINICSGVRINSRYEHSIYFASASAQQEYFAGKVVKTFSAYSYLRKSWPLKVEATMEQAKIWNYLFFRNTASGKMYYYFINEVEYINDSTVELTLELDVIQTYLFDFTLLTSFVERQHVTDDTVGAHTLDESLELGEFVSNANGDLTSYNDFCILVLSTIILNGVSAETTVPALSFVYNNTFSGLYLSAIDMDDWQAWGSQLENLSEWGKLDGIVSMWMYPKELVVLGGENEWGDDTLAKVVLTVKTVKHTIPQISSKIDGYTPKNNKLFCYPFNFMYVTNNNGGSAVYHYERFTGNPEFRVYGALSPDAGMKLAPLNYKGCAVNYDEGISLPGFPTCAWDADVYKMWLAQNQATHDLTNAQGGVKILAGAVATIAGAATGNIAGAVGGVGTMYSGASQIAGLVAAKKDMEVQPPQARGAFSASINMANDKATFSYYQKSVCAENAKIIDRYFTMYGYKVNCYQVPNINARPAFTYVKTIGCHIQGNMCNEDTVKVENIFDQGITFWKNGDKVGDYTQNNTV